MTTVADALRAGANALRERGHVRRRPVGPGGEVCMAAAISVATDLTAMYDALPVMNRYVEEVLGYKRQIDSSDSAWRGDLSVEWQNEAARDGEEVAVVMEKAAAWWEEQGN